MNLQDEVVRNKKITNSKLGSISMDVGVWRLLASLNGISDFLRFLLNLLTL
jgi:hypothetical protein